MGKQVYIDYLHNIFVDALCCCQANDVPPWCQGSCMNGKTKQYVYNRTETPKNDMTEWMVSVISEVSIHDLLFIQYYDFNDNICIFIHFQHELFFGGACKEYGNIIAGCWKQIHPDRKLLIYQLRWLLIVIHLRALLITAL